MGGLVLVNCAPARHLVTIEADRRCRGLSRRVPALSPSFDGHSMRSWTSNPRPPPPPIPAAPSSSSLPAPLASLDLEYYLILHPFFLSLSVSLYLLLD